MKFLIVLAVAVACVASDANVPIVKSELDISPEGSYQYAYETGNGIYAQEQGVLKNINNEYASIEAKGGFKYTAPDGTPIEVTYIADENGFQPQGAHLPVPPPFPEAIARSLAYIAAHPPPAERVSATAFQG